APTLWPVQGRITGSFGERIDPFNGEGAFHRGVDISSDLGTRVIAPADGIVEFSDQMNGYGRTVVIDHGNGISTLYGHLSGFTGSPGQLIHRGDTLGYVGQTGGSTGPHLHYESASSTPQSTRTNISALPSLSRSLPERCKLQRFFFSGCGEGDGALVRPSGWTSEAIFFKKLCENVAVNVATFPFCSTRMLSSAAFTSASVPLAPTVLETLRYSARKPVADSTTCLASASLAVKTSARKSAVPL